METVSIATSSGYELPALREAVIRLLEPLGGISAFINRGERILLKPNLLAAKDPDLAVTTHPALVQVVAELVKEAGGIVLIGDSPGIGGFTRVAGKCGIINAARASGATLIEFEDAVELQGGGTFRSIHLARAYYEADKIINLPKLKTHEMMTMTCAVKNLFGAVVGTEKAGWHLKAGRSQQLFARLLLEIYLLKKPVLNIVDAINAMEGDGPGSGDPIKLGLLIAGVNPVAVDVIAGRLAGIPERLLPIGVEAVSMGLPGAAIGDILLCGVPLESIPQAHFRLPAGMDVQFGLPPFLAKALKSQLTSYPAGMDVQFGLPPFLAKALKSQLTSYPAADMKACVLCGICRDACPPGAITMQNSALSVDNARCIRCWCCRELCPHGAMRISRGVLLKILGLLPGKRGSCYSSSSAPSGISR